MIGINNEERVIVPAIIKSNFSRMRYHVFISHFQMEASGDVGTMFHMLHKFGVNSWRDMNVSNLTETSMCQGVYDSDVFILFLTNAVLSRNYCLKEIGWALHFQKPIVIVVEKEDRFWNWDWDRWVSDACERVPGTTTRWTKGWLQNDFQSIYVNHKIVYDLIKQHYDLNTMLPFRRREFEVDALVTKIMEVAADSGVSWKLPLCLAASQIVLITVAKVMFIFDPQAEDIINEFKLLLLAHCERLEWTDDYQNATNVIVFLSHNVLDVCFDQLDMLASSERSAGIFIYSNDHEYLYTLMIMVGIFLNFIAARIQRQKD